MNDSIIPTKICTACNKELPATTEFFHRQKEGAYGLHSTCKSCKNEYRHKHYRANREKVLEQGRQYVLANREAKKNYQIQYRKANKEKYTEYYQRYRKKDSGKRTKYFRQYQQENREKVQINQNRRRARKQGLPDTLTPEQWQFAIEYFHGCCAVCGRQLKDLFGTHTLAADHWMPISHPDCPGTIALNMIPLCHGENGCNNSKSNTLPDEWLERKYGKRKAKQILKRIEDYFEWVRSQ